MNAILICNVGGRDVVSKAFPKDNIGERTWAETVLARYHELYATLRLPIIGKALQYLAERQIALDHVILIASDQPPPPDGNDQFWSSDTIHSAAIIRRLLSEGHTPYPALPTEQITIWTIRDERDRGCDPSDYDLTLRFLERQLTKLQYQYPQHTAFLEVTGGTPAMTTGLLIAGTEVFGSRAEVLSIHPAQEIPIALNTGKRLLATPLRATLRSNAATYAYAAAARTFLEQEAIITDRLDPKAASLIDPLLDYAHYRFNFDFANARKALAKIDHAGPWQTELATLQAQVVSPDRRSLLAEVVHGAAARYEIGLYADFLVQVVRFEENLLRYLCLLQGAEFRNRRGSSDPDGPYLAREWLQQQPFTLSRDRDRQRDLPVDRSVLRELIGQLLYPPDHYQQALLQAIDRLGELVKRRNELTHHLEGVQKIGLARAFAGQQASSTAADQIVPHLQQLYEAVCKQPLPPSPYQQINHLLERLLQSKE